MIRQTEIRPAPLHFGYFSLAINWLDLHSDAKFVLVVEKEASFQRLMDDNVLQRLHPCIIITVSTSLASSTACFPTECLKTRIEVITIPNQMKGKYQEEPIRTQRKRTKVNCLKRGKTQATKSRLVLVLHRIGWERGARFLSRPITVRRKAKPKNTKLPIALFGHYTTFTFTYRSIAL